MQTSYILLATVLIIIISGGAYLMYKKVGIPFIQPISKPTPPTGVDIDGTYVPQGSMFCMPGVIIAPGNLVKSQDWFNGQSSALSTYKLSSDPEIPQVQIDGHDYYFRQLAEKCSDIL